MKIPKKKRPPPERVKGLPPCLSCWNADGMAEPAAWAVQQGDTWAFVCDRHREVFVRPLSAPGPWNDFKGEEPEVGKPHLSLQMEPDDHKRVVAAARKERSNVSAWCRQGIMAHLAGKHPQTAAELPEPGPDVAALRAELRAAQQKNKSLTKSLDAERETASARLTVIDQMRQRMGEMERKLRTAERTSAPAEISVVADDLVDELDDVAGDEPVDEPVDATATTIPASSTITDLSGHVLALLSLHLAQGVVDLVTRLQQDPALLAPAGVRHALEQLRQAAGEKGGRP